MKLLRSIAVILLMALGVAGGPAVAEDGGKSPMFMSLTLVDPHGAHMALSVAELAAKAGHPVTVFLNLEAVRIADKDGTMFNPARDDLARSMAAGVKVMACEHCLAFAGMSSGDLVDGVEVSTGDALLGAIFAPDTRVLSY